MQQKYVDFIKVIECLQYLSRQGHVMQGGTDDESNFIQLLKIRGKDFKMVTPNTIFKMK